MTVTVLAPNLVPAWQTPEAHVCGFTKAAVAELENP